MLHAGLPVKLPASLVKRLGEGHDIDSSDIHHSNAPNRWPCDPPGSLLPSSHSPVMWVIIIYYCVASLEDLGAKEQKTSGRDLYVHLNPASTSLTSTKLLKTLRKPSPCPWWGISQEHSDDTCAQTQEHAVPSASDVLKLPRSWVP